MMRSARWASLLLLSPTLRIAKLKKEPLEMLEFVEEQNETIQQMLREKVDLVKLLGEKELEIERLSRDVVPAYHRSALESLAKCLGREHGCLKMATRKRLVGGSLVEEDTDDVNVSETIKALRETLGKNCDPNIVAGSQWIFKKLSKQLHGIAPPMTIHSAKWSGLDEEERLFMSWVYDKSIDKKIIVPPAKQPAEPPATDK